MSISFKVVRLFGWLVDCLACWLVGWFSCDCFRLLELLLAIINCPYVLERYSSSDGSFSDVAVAVVVAVDADAVALNWFLFDVVVVDSSFRSLLRNRAA